MTSLDAIAEIENRNSAPLCLPSLGEAFGLLSERWAAGEQDRETALRLMFLSWYSQAEPPYLTGLSGDLDTPSVFGDAFASLGGAQSTDPEICFVVGTMTTLFPWSLGDQVYWESMGRQLLVRAAGLAPDGVNPDVFLGRGAYGAYFRHMLANNSSGG